MEKRQTVNTINLAGVLVDKNLTIKDDLIDKKTGNTYTAISGSLVIRTEDGSEVEVKAYSKELTKDGKENSIFKGLCTVSEEYVTLKESVEGADKIRVGACEFGVNDYKSKQDGTIKTYNDISAKFFNRLTEKDLELTPLQSRFEVEGVIAELKDIVKKDGTPTGDKLIILNVLGYEGRIIPITLTLPEKLVQPFMSMGYFVGSVATLWGKIVNIQEEQKIVEEAGFGESIERVVTRNIKRNEITGGKPPVDLNTTGYTLEEYNQALANRKLKLDNLLNSQSNTTQTTTAQTSNPFGQATQSTFNPFSQQ